MAHRPAGLRGLGRIETAPVRRNGAALACREGGRVKGQVSVGVCRAEVLVVANHPVVGAEDGVVGDVNQAVSVQIGRADETGIAFR